MVEVGLHIQGSPESGEHELLELLGAVLSAVEDVDDAHRGMGSLTEVQVLVERYRRFVDAVRLGGDGQVGYRLCLRRLPDGKVIDGRYLIEVEMDTPSPEDAGGDPP